VNADFVKFVSRAQSAVCTLSKYM